MSASGSTSSRGTAHSRSPSRSRSPPYSDGRYPPRYSSRYDSYGYRPRNMSAQIDDYWEIRDRGDRERDRERDRDRDRSMMLMRDDRYIRGRDDRFPPYYRDDISASHHYQSNTNLPREPNKPSSSTARLESNVDRQPAISTKSKDDTMKPTTPTEIYPSRYNDWRDRDRDRDRRYRDDDRRRDYDRRNRDGYNMRYDNSSYPSSSTSGYPPPPFGGDSYRPGARDREPASPGAHPYYDRDGRDRFDDREFYRPISRGPSMDFDRYRNRPRPNSSSNTNNTVDRNASSSSWRTSSRERSGGGSEREKDVSGKTNYGSSVLSSSKDDIKSHTTRLDDMDSNEKSSIPSVSSNTKINDDITKTGSVYDQLPSSSLSQSSHDDKINDDTETKEENIKSEEPKNKTNFIPPERSENIVDKTKKKLKIEILPRSTVSDNQMDIDSPLSSSTQVPVQSSASINLSKGNSLSSSSLNLTTNDNQVGTTLSSASAPNVSNIDHSIIKTELIPETSKLTNDNNNSNNDSIKKEVEEEEEEEKQSVFSLPNDSNDVVKMEIDSVVKKEDSEKSISVDENKENSNPESDNKDYIKPEMTQQQIVSRIDEIENDISMYEEMLEQAAKRESELQQQKEEKRNVNMEAGSPIDIKEDDDDEENEHEQEEAKQKALQAISENSQPMTDIQNLPFNESPVMRRRPQILINQIRTQDDDIDEALSKMIISKNKELAKENSRLLSGWQGKPDDGSDWSDEEKWYAPLYKNIQDYPCYNQNIDDFKKTKLSMAHYLANNSKLLKQKERRLKREYKEIYNQWKNKNMALDRMRDQERRGSDRYNSSGSTRSSGRRSGRGGGSSNTSAVVDEEPEEYLDGIIFTGNHDALRFNMDGNATPFGGGGGNGRSGGKSAWTSDAARSEAELLEIIQSLESAEMRNPELRAAKTTATIPAMILDVKERSRTYNDRSGLIEDPLTYYHTGAETEDVWTQQEMTAFMESYMQYPKQFDKISASVQTKTAPQCVLFYYRKKTKIDFKALMRKGRRGKNKKRDRLAAAIRRATSDTSAITRKGKSKGSALMADIGQAQVSRKAKEKDSEGKSKELRELEEANAYWESVAERRKSKRPTSNANSTNTTTTTTTSSSSSLLTSTLNTTATNTDDHLNLNSEASSSIARRKVNRRKGRSPRSSVTSVPDSSLIFPEDSADEAGSTAPSTPALSSSSAIVSTVTPVTPNNTSNINNNSTALTSTTSTTSTTSNINNNNNDNNNNNNIATPTTKQRQTPSTGNIIRDVTPDSTSSNSLSVSTAKWNDQDKQAAVEAFRLYGRDFVKVSAKVGTKTDEQCRNFYFNHKRKYGPNAFNESGKESISEMVATPTASTSMNDTSLPSSAKVTSISNIVSSSPTSPKQLVTSETGRTDLKAEEEDAAAALVGMFQMGANRDLNKETTTATATPSPNPSTPTTESQQQKNRRRVRTTSGKFDTIGLNEGWSTDDTSVSTGRTGGNTINKKSTAELKRGSNSSYWSVSERGEFVQYLEIYGRDWTKVANAMKSKTAIQVRNFYQNNEEKMQLSKIIQRHEANQPNTIPSSSSQPQYSKYNTAAIDQKHSMPPIGASYEVNPSSPSVLRQGPLPPRQQIPQQTGRSPFYHPSPPPPTTTSSSSSPYIYPANVEHMSSSPSSSSMPPTQPSVYSPADRANYFSPPARSTQSPIIPTSNYYSDSPPSHSHPPPSSFTPVSNSSRPLPPSGPVRDILNPTPSSPSSSTVTKVSDLLNSNEEAEETSNRNTWQSWFGGN